MQRFVSHRGWLALLLSSACATEPSPTVAPAEPSPAPAPLADNPMSTAAAPAKLDVARLAYVSIPGGQFPSRSEAKTGPSLVMAVHEPEEDDPVRGIAVRLAEKDETIVLSPPMVKVLGLAAVEEVWLFGPEGPCRAELGSPYATGYQDGFLALEVGYRLTPCTSDFAPVAHVGPQPPPLRWKDAEVEVSEEITEPEDWEHEMRPVLDGWKWTESSDPANPPEIWARIKRAGAAVELGYAHHWTGDSCEDESEDVHVELGLWQGGRLRELPAVVKVLSGDEGLVGSLLDGDDVALVVAALRLQMHVWAPDAPEGWTEFTTGSYHDEDLVGTTWSVAEFDCEP